MVHDRKAAEGALSSAVSLLKSSVGTPGVEGRRQDSVDSSAERLLHMRRRLGQCTRWIVGVAAAKGPTVNPVPVRSQHGGDGRYDRIEGHQRTLSSQSRTS